MDRRFWRAVSKAFRTLGGSKGVEQKRPLRIPTTRRITLEPLEDRRLLSIDFGDAPSPYSTWLSDDGARHEILGPTLGASVDSETDGQPTDQANGDDLNGADDEDGVTFGTIQVGQLDAIAIVNVQNASSGARLDAWIDFDGDGCWGGPSERIADSVAVVEGDNTITFDVPSWALSGETYARFRLSTAGNLAPAGAAADGEVEDYQVMILPPETGSGVFAARTAIAGYSGTPGEVRSVDLDGDGDTDILAACSWDDTVVWFENDGVGNFVPHLIAAGVEGALSVFAEDMDHDGDIDVLSASYEDNTIAWHENDGEEHFTVHAISSTTARAQSVSAADFDGDGDMDVLAASAADNVVLWFESNGNGDFITHTITDNAVTAVSVFVADIDGDGDMDALSASASDDKIAWYENNGSGQFTTHAITVSANGAYSVFATDVDGDGDTDVLSASRNDDKIAWYENDGNEVFTAHLITTSADRAWSVFAADLDGDGDMDVLSASELDDTVAWYENDGEENFAAHIVTSSSDGPHYVLAADVNGDGNMDVLSSSVNDNRVAWCENDGGENFVTHTIAATVNGPRSVFAADMDNDGDMDVLSASEFDHRIAWYENDGGTRFTLHTITSSASAAYSVFAADVDGDGNMDVLSTSYSDSPTPGSIQWHRNNGDGTFTTRTIVSSVDGASSVFAADVDGDGDMDVLSNSWFSNTITWYEQTASGGFAAHVISSSADAPICVYAADVDGDGDMDVLSASASDDTIAWYENDGNEQFTWHAITSSADSAQRVSAADVDGDGDIDVIATTGGDDRIAWYENDGSETFAAHAIVSAEAGSAIFTADLDGDGDLDLISSSSTDGVIPWFENDGIGNFTPRLVLTSELGPNSVFAADVDGDGDLDLLASSRVSRSSASSMIVWYENLEEPPGFTITEQGGSTTVSESPTTDTFTVVLNTAPSNNVVITVTSDDPGEATVDKATLTFTPTNWATAQTVTVTGVDDALMDGNQTTTITLAIDDSNSDDLFDAVADQTVTVTTLDDDSLDFGDAPAPYPTALSMDGARHVATGPTLGTSRDTEADGQPTAMADGDDTNGTADEDGIAGASSFAPGMTNAWVDVLVSADSYVNAWIDFNGDGTWDTSEQLATDLALTAGTNHVTFAVPATAVPGITYARLRLTSYDTSGTLLPTGLAEDGEVEDYIVEIDDDLYLYGTAGDDTVVVTTDGSDFTVTINGIANVYSTATYSSIVINADGGADSLDIYDWTGNDTFAVDPTEATMDWGSDGVDVTGLGFETVKGIATNGGTDMATLTGTTGADKFYGKETQAYVYDAAGTDYRYTASGFDTVTGVSGGGDDTAYLYDSTGNDALDVTVGSATMTRSGSTTSVASGFAYINGYAVAGGTDVATMTSTTGTDVFTGKDTYAYMRNDGGADYLLYVTGFGEVTAYGDDSDTAYLYGGVTDDILDMDMGSWWAMMIRSGLTKTAANGFGTVNGYAGAGGTDTTWMTGTTGTDMFSGKESGAYMRNVGGTTDYFLYAASFSQVTANGNGGVDLAYLYGSSGDDTLDLSPSSATMIRSGSTTTVANDFATAYGYAMTGGTNTATMTGTTGADAFYGRESLAYMRNVGGSDYFLYARDFSEVTANAGGGDDAAYLWGSTGDDTLDASVGSATMIRSASTTTTAANDFATVYGFATSGGTDTANLTGSTGDDVFYSREVYSILRDAASSAYQFYVGAFSTVEAYGNSGAGDVAYLYGSAGDDTLNLTVASSTMTRTGSSTAVATDFANVNGYAVAGGTDTATLTGTTGSDKFTGKETYGYMENDGGADYTLYADKFSEVTAYGGGGDDTAYLYGSTGDDALTVSAGLATMTRAGSTSTEANDFATVKGYAVTGGADTATLTGTTGADTFTGREDWGLLTDSDWTDYYYLVRYFDEVYAEAGDTTTGNDTLNVPETGGAWDVDYLFDPGNLLDW